MPKADVSRIVADCRRSLRRLVAHAEKIASETGSPELRWPQHHVQHFTAMIRKYGDQLRAFDNTTRSMSRSRVGRAQERILGTYPPRIAAALRTFASVKVYASPDEIIEFSHGLLMDQFPGEAVVVRLQKPTGGKLRPIGLSGLKRRGQQLIIRDMLAVRCGDNPNDSTVAGSGGERWVFKRINELVQEGYEHFVSVDIKSFFPSVKPGHLAGFPLPEWVVQNIVFLPSTAKLRLAIPEHDLCLDESDLVSGNQALACLPYSVGDLSTMLKTVRQGLIQGDVSSPQIARTFLGRELQRTLGKRGVRWFSHSDDILICARSRSKLLKSLEALQKRLGNHPVGPLQLKSHDLATIDGGVEYLGYRFHRTKNKSLRVRPALKRFHRLRERLFGLWREMDDTMDVATLRNAGLQYARHWYSSQSVWTKAKPSDPDKPYSSASWQSVAYSVEECLNYFLFRLFENGFIEISNWVNFDHAEDFHLKTNGVHAF
jgi:hypothetical protein